ncbi:hypothetical protein [Paludisphaera mucosa]|uniref:Uncharacterized protein n=1 Tax=Paludisphaera mucosa TaxID=3030827 RepID=A0ABT6FEK7_9BACT|nr:hypothetical protein [Paludisphaera mucosa]MDG3006012.1 hypothetical protein [Paludisphaera mucosa]
MTTIRRSVRILLSAFGMLLAGFSSGRVNGEARAQAPAGPLGVASLRDMSESELQAVYRQGTAVALPAGRVRGTVLPAPGTRRNAAMSVGARAIWQGKIVDPTGATAVNRFFGVSTIRGQLYQAESWLDGNPSLILDYAKTSRVYAKNRDEIRRIGPGLYLGLMYSRTSPQPTLSMYFVLEVES